MMSIKKYSTRFLSLPTVEQMDHSSEKYLVETEAFEKYWNESPEKKRHDS